MKQQINLYVAQVPVHRPCSARTCLLLLSVAIALVLLLSVVETAGLSDLRQQVAAQTLQKSQLQSETQTLRQQKRSKTESATLTQLHDQLQQTLADQSRLMELLEQHAPQHRGIFSPLLNGLSEQALKGVRLSRIQASHNGALISLQGHANNAGLIADYLQRLGQAAAYQNARFDRFELTEAGAGIQFRVSGRRFGGGA